MKWYKAGDMLWSHKLLMITDQRLMFQVFAGGRVHKKNRLFMTCMFLWAYDLILRSIYICTVQVNNIWLLGQIISSDSVKTDVSSLQWIFRNQLIKTCKNVAAREWGMYANCCGLHGDKTMHWSLRVSLNSKIYCLIFKFQLDSPEKVIRQVTSLNHRQRNKDFRAEYLKVPYIFPGHHESLPVS